jgi:hypothetical protein
MSAALFFASVGLSALVASSLGADVPKWIKRWLAALWIAAALTFCVGAVLAPLTLTRTPTPNGLVVTMQTPLVLQWLTLGLIWAALVVAAIGTVPVSVAAWKALAARPFAQLVNWRGAAFGCLQTAVGIALMSFSGPFTITQDGMAGLPSLIVMALGLGLFLTGVTDVIASLRPAGPSQPPPPKA